MAGMAITLKTQIEANALPGTQGPGSVSSARGWTAYQPSSDILSTADWGRCVDVR